MTMAQQSRLASFRARRSVRARRWRSEGRSGLAVEDVFQGEPGYLAGGW